MRYWELGRWRFWRTSDSTYGTVTHMLNRGLLDAAEPPRRAEDGAQPIAWEGPPWEPSGTPWPPGWIERDGEWVYDLDLDPGP